MSRPANTVSPLQQGEVRVYLVDLSAQMEREITAGEGLSTAELARSQTYKFVQDRRRFLARRVVLRSLLAQISCIPVNEINYEVSPNGRLSLAMGAPSFSLSACGNMAAYAFTVDGPVGIDLEMVRPLDDLPGLLQHSFSPVEQAALENLPEALRLDAFFHVWTQKEAYLKACGLGFSLEPTVVTVEADPRLPGRLRSTAGAEPAGWRMVTLEPLPGWRLAVCVKLAEERWVVLKVGDAIDYLTL
jgi:4'-phosphopantetheinyl transferase